MNLILDANFTVLVLLPKAKPLLRTLQKFVRFQVSVIISAVNVKYQI